MQGKKTLVGLLSVIICSVVLISWGIIGLIKAHTVTNTIATTSSKESNFKILVIEINPTLKTVPGKPKVSEYLHGPGEEKVAVNEMIEDLEFSSGGFLNIETKWEYLDEFPKYNNQFIRPDGTSGYSYNESNYLSIVKNDDGSASWNNLLSKNAFSAMESYDFDYDYIIDKFNLIERRNNHEFDQVWLASIDPSQTFETLMIGRNAFWINGAPIVKDCDNFVLANVSISRRDANTHALGHGMEGIMENAYGLSYNPYEKDSISISTVEQYKSLNLWERFMLNDYANTGTLNGVGTIHHPFNADHDYDYSNTKKVATTFSEWLSGKAFDSKGETTLQDNSAWLNWYGTTSLGASSNKDPDRLYTRLWFYLFPREDGLTRDGYYKNWWKYFTTLDNVVDVKMSSNKINLKIGETLQLEYTLRYDSGKITKTKLAYGANVHVSNGSLLGVKDGKLVAITPGETTITVYRDGRSASATVTISKPEPSQSTNKEEQNSSSSNQTQNKPSQSTSEEEQDLSSSDTNYSSGIAQDIPSVGEIEASGIMPQYDDYWDYNETIEEDAAVAGEEANKNQSTRIILYVAIIVVGVTDIIVAVIVYRKHKAKAFSVVSDESAKEINKIQPPDIN